MGSLPPDLTLKVICQHLPTTFAGAPVHLGIQQDRAVVEIAPASGGAVVFHPRFRLTDAGGSPNFLGPFAQGPRSERFFYLAWGTGRTLSDFGMYRRLKIHLSHLTWKHIAASARAQKTLCVTLDLTDRHGGPRCGSAWPDDPGVMWNPHDAPAGRTHPVHE